MTVRFPRSEFLIWCCCNFDLSFIDPIKIIIIIIRKVPPQGSLFPPEYHGLLRFRPKLSISQSRGFWQSKNVRPRPLSSACIWSLICICFELSYKEVFSTKWITATNMSSFPNFTYLCDLWCKAFLLWSLLPYYNEVSHSNNFYDFKPKQVPLQI